MCVRAPVCRASRTTSHVAVLVPQDLVISSTPGMIISAVGTVLIMTLFFFELSEYFTVKATTTLVVDEFIDDTIRANFNITVHAVPCEFLSVDVSDLTGTRRATRGSSNRFRGCHAC